MRVASAAKIKGAKRGGPTNDAPREGTAIRAVYDMFLKHRGHVVPFAVHRGDGEKIRYLRDFYGLDIRHVSYGRWLLAGEWFGRVYVDYTHSPGEPPAKEEAA